MVDFPAPDGPLITMGWFAERASLETGAVSVGAIVKARWVKVREETGLQVVRRYAVLNLGSGERVTRAIQLLESVSRLCDSQESVNGMPIVSWDNAGC